ncbi:hypothetical protein FHS37_006583 [Streptomyces griseostramineus]|uniref:Uncharacterized protein n=1 Tax=Streptomyces griseomycini TaxID=66895 RepID=A0A7W7PWF4_9ACTN|nr:hypothetical protein [Streptomyces griseomycini]
MPDTAAPGEPPAAGQDGPEGNLVILDSAWTTAV